MNPFIWIIDECWSEYDLEHKLFRARYPDCAIQVSPYAYQEDLRAFGTRADVILCQVFASMPAEAIRQLERCRGIAVYGGGYDLVDVAAARQCGIPVANVPDYCKDDVADYVMASIYHFSKRIWSYGYPLKEGAWSLPPLQRRIRRLRGASLLVVGFGSIGRTVAAKGRGAGMQVQACDPYVDAGTMRRLGVEKVALDEGLARADIVTVHTRADQGRLGYEHFRAMKPGSCLINAARGRCIVEKDLVRAMQEGLIGCAVLDVVEAEPPTLEEAVFHCEGILVTPHIAYFSQDSYTELKTRTVENAVSMLEGLAPPGLVN